MREWQLPLHSDFGPGVTAGEVSRGVVEAGGVWRQPHTASANDDQARDLADLVFQYRSSGSCTILGLVI